MNETLNAYGKLAQAMTPNPDWFLPFVIGMVIIALLLMIIPLFLSKKKRKEF
jgi:hypothetical protein